MLIPFILTTVLAGAAIIAFLLLRKKPAKVLSSQPKAWRNEFQGLDLKVWAHLGFIELKMNDLPYVVHLFCKHEDHTTRTYRIQASDYAKNQLETYHSYIHKYLQPWVLGSKDIYYLINNPSRFLEDYMAERYGHAWSDEKKWWEPSERAKHSAAAKKQKATTKKETPVTSVEENVVQVNFGKKDNEG